ncbi:MAG: MFS transporter, partial [Simkaniaceae bacterium]|nr:MFS transporter [Simkaniaceae bacterium]
HIYHEKHIIRESGFSIYYSSVNLGVFLAMIILGYVMHHYGWKLVFVIAAVVQLLGLIAFLPVLKFMKTHKVKHHVFFKEEHKSKYPLHRHEKRRLFVIGILAITSILFWIPYSQSASSITLFILKYVDRTVLGETLPLPWFISLESFFLIIFALPLASLYFFLRKVRSNPNPIMKTAFSMVFMGLCFLVLVRATGNIHLNASSDSINPIYLVFSFALMAISELLIAPIGLSLITNLSPRRYTAFLVGCWYMCIGIGYYLGGYLAGLITSTSASTFFNIFVVTSFITAFILAIFAKKLNKMRHVEVLGSRK